MRLRLLPALAACILAAGCGSLLPRSSSDTPSPFGTFAQAEAAARRIVPFRTRVGDLAPLGFDPVGGRNVTLISYPEVIGRLAPYPGVPLAELDPGIRQCILARQACRAWLFRFERVDRRREGEFWADFLNVRRVTRITGWWFEALVVADEDTVLFHNVAGQARIDRQEQSTNPLGPLQDAGEGVGGALMR